MNYINPPKELPKNVTHKTFYSQLINHEIGYNIYLPLDYENNNVNYPVHYHLHGWKSNESSDIYNLEKLYINRQAITVFTNNSPHIEDNENIPVEEIFIKELITYIDKEYKSNSTRENRSI